MTTLALLFEKPVRLGHGQLLGTPFEMLILFHLELRQYVCGGYRYRNGLLVIPCSQCVCECVKFIRFDCQLNPHFLSLGRFCSASFLATSSLVPSLAKHSDTSPFDTKSVPSKVIFTIDANSVQAELTLWHLHRFTRTRANYHFRPCPCLLLLDAGRQNKSLFHQVRQLQILHQHSI